MENNIVLETRNLHKTFSGVPAVQDVSLKVRRGDVFGFLGPNGAGKTTTIAMILGLLHASKGEIRIFGQKVTPNHNAVLTKVGALVGALPALIPYLSAKDNLKLMSQLHPEISPQRVDEVLEFVGLAEVAKQTPNKFSTGMKQRLGMALAILHKPQLLILDEPTNGMDPVGMQEIRRLIQFLAKEGVTILLSSHLLYEVEQVCNCIAVLNKGKLMAQGTLDEMRGEKQNVKIKGQDLEKVADLLKDLPDVAHLEKTTDSVEVRGVASEVILKYLAEQNYYPSEVFYTGSDLEQLFLNLTQGENVSTKEMPW